MSKTKKHIVFLTPGFPGDEEETNCIPFLQRFVYGFAKLYPQYRFSVITFQYPFVAKQYDWQGIKVYALNGGNKRYFNKLVTWRKVFNTFKELYNIDEETVIHSFWLSECAFIGQKIAQKYNLRHVNMMMGQDCYPSNKYLKILNLNNFDIVSGSDFTAERLNKIKGSVQVKRIIKGIDEWNFKEVTSPRTIDIIGVGNLSELKNYLRFVKIIHQLKLRIPNIKSVIVGSESNQSEEVVAYIKENNLDENITLVPFSTREEVLEYMSKSKLLLHTSTTEEQPYVILEALACGAHVVSTPVGELPYPDRVTYLNDDNLIVNKLNNLLHDELEYTMYVPFSLSATIKAYNDLYFQEK